MPKTHSRDDRAFGHMPAVEMCLRIYAEEIATAFPSVALPSLMFYMPHVDGHFRCPYCWLIYREVNALDADEFGLPRDHLRCKTCEENFDLPLQA